MNKTITVKGTGKLSLKPDLTVVTMALKTVNKNYDKAMQEEDKLFAALKAALAGADIAEEELKTTNFNVWSEYEGRQDKNGVYRNVFKGYAVQNDLMLEFPFDTARLSKVLSLVAECVADPALNIRFTVKDRMAAEDELLKSAAKNARRKAEVLTAASGTKLGELVSISYSWDELNLTSSTTYGAMKCMDSCVEERITPMDVNVEDTATFVWELI